LLQPLLRLPQTIKRALALRDRLAGIISRRRLRLLHLISRLIELTAQLLHLRVAAFARQTFQLPRSLARLVDQLLLLSLIAAATATIRGLLSAPALLLERLLLPARKLFQTAFGFTLLLLGLLLLRALHGLVLVLHLVELELEQTSEFLLLSLTTVAAALALIAKSDLHFAKDRVGGEQFL
jgi:hypothetical protein